MKNEIDLGNYIVGALISKMSSIIEDGGDNFNAIVSASGLDPARDFRHADLRGVCFDDSDLRGFNFSGADLSDAHGICVRFDDSTIFDRAKADNSIFAQRIRRDKFFENNPRYHLNFLKMRNAYWTHTIEWVDDNLRQNAKDRKNNLEVAKALFENSNDTVLRSNILLFMSRAFERDIEYRDFLVSTISKNIDDIKTMRVAVRAISEFYNDDWSVYCKLKKIGSHERVSREIRDAAAFGVVQSKFFIKEWRDIFKQANEFPEQARRAMLRKVASRRGDSYIVATMEPIGGRCLDFAEPLSAGKVDAIARRVASLQLARANADSMRNRANVEPSAKSVSTLSKVVLRHLAALKADGVPFVFSKELQEASERAQSQSRQDIRSIM